MEEQFYFNPDIFLRTELAVERISEIQEETTLHAEFKPYFDTVAGFLLDCYDAFLCVSKPQSGSDEALCEMNRALYADILPEHYAESFANPDYAAKCLGEELGPVLSAVYAELRSAIGYAFEEKQEALVGLMELFLMVYGLFSEEELPKKASVKDAVYYYMLDYMELLYGGRTEETLLSDGDALANRILESADLSEPAYLYRYGEYITENEIKTVRYLSGLPEEKILAMAKTYVDGFVRGYQTMRIDITKKKTVNIRYTLGFERVVRCAIRLFEEHGLKPIVFRYATCRLNRRLTNRVGYIATPANKQYEYDHRMDEAVFLNKAICERKLEVLKKVYEAHREEARTYGGPAVMETFGETPFVPKSAKYALKLSEEQNKLSVETASRASEIANQYMPRDDYSFTIIAYPIPEIGENFSEIFDEIIKVNTLDNDVYTRVQQSIIDCLDQAEHVLVKGAGENKTDMKVMLHRIDRGKETNFENCVADVNIPVGEVFTSPVLTGTEGVLHVSSVYLNDLKYENLSIRFENGCMADYSCDNFEDPEEGKRFIEENLMFHHRTLPIGEFAIGTNTVAYEMARRLDILKLLPILIVEKMGPHFAVGDTCYSYSEEAKLFNPDGKEIVAKENECSLKRHSEDPEEKKQAYFNCHTDITIPYEELAGIWAVKADGGRTAIIENGRFVLPGTELLNKPLEG